MFKRKKIYLPSLREIAEACSEIRLGRNNEPDEIPWTTPLSKRVCFPQEFLVPPQRKPSTVNNLETLNDATD